MAGCAATNAPSRAATQPGGSPAPEQAIRAIAEFFARGSEGRLLIDPRRLRERADLTGLDADDVSPDSAVTASTLGLLAQQGVQPTDAVRDMRCAFVRGATHPPEILAAEPEDYRRIREECLQRGLYTTVIFGTPRLSRAGATQDVWIVRAVRMTTSSYSVWDVPVRAGASGTWEVLEPVRISAVMS